MNDKPEIKTLDALGRPGRNRVYNDITETIGNTPMVRLSRLTEASGTKASILMKLEFFNPLSSVKDRIGVAMVDALEASGRLKKSTVIVEPTSGNTGIALAFVAAARGYRLILTMPESMSIERRRILEHLGAEVQLSPRGEGMKGAIALAQQLVRELPDAVMPGQFDNPANPFIHERTTAEEIWADTGGNIDALVIGVGTGGTLTGAGRVLKKRKPGLKVIAVEPSASPVLSGGAPGSHKIQGIGAGFVPAILQTDLIDEVIKVPNEMAFDASRLLARVEGIAGGISTGANLAASLTIAAREEMEGKTIVTFAPSAVDRYLSTELFVAPAGGGQSV
jgi:cysteine synthase A